MKQLQRDAPAFIHHASQLPEVIPQFLALQRQAISDTPSQRSSKVGADLFIGSGLTILIMTLALDLQSGGYTALGMLLLTAGLLTRSK